MTKDQKYRRARSIAEALETLTNGQGYAVIECNYDSATGEPYYSIDVRHERDGERLQRTGVSADELIDVLASVL